MTRSRDTADQINRINSSAANATAITVDSSENVSLTGALDVTGALNIEGASGTQLVVEASSGNFAQMDFKIGGTQKGAIWVNEATDLMGYYAPSGWGKNFYTNGAERMRLIADGSWMVGNTVANTASGYSAQPGVGWVNSDTHFEIATTSNRAALEVGKNNSNDGDLIALRKQGNMVGSIGTSGNQSYIHGAGTDVGLFWGSNNVYPYRSTGLNDATIDLGQASKRFKDLYLSGGVVFSDAGATGTSSSNTMSSYEVGTWTPTILNGWGVTSPTFSTNEGFYVKVGSVVHISFKMVLSGGSTNGNALKLQGLPFNVAKVTHISGSFAAASSNAENVFLGIAANEAYPSFYRQTNTTYESFTGTNAGSGFSLTFSGTYQT